MAAYQIVYFHVPAAFTALSGFFVALAASGLYLATGNFKYDEFAAAVTEVALAFATVNLVTGSIWARYAWGIWWTWDARLTSMLTCWLIYAGYMILRRSIEEPTQRARLSAVLSIFGCVDVGFVYKSIEWFRTQHPSPGAQHPRRWRDGAGNGSAHLLELSGAGLPFGDPDHRAHASGRDFEGNRFPAPHGPFLLTETSLEPREFQFVFGGFTVAWLIVIVYVISIASRERRLRKELDRVRKMVEGK